MGARRAARVLITAAGGLESPPWPPEPGSLADRLSRLTGRLARPRSWPEELELRRLRRLPRYQPSTTGLLGPTLQVIDGPSFASAWEAIFQRGLYDFPAATEAPRILDCGANVGLATLAWTRRWPSARITAFEPDPRAFAALAANCAAAGRSGVELVQAAVWREAGQVHLQLEGADASSLIERPGLGASTPVRAVRLRDLLDAPVDLLKLDVEGAEVDLLVDCAQALGQVARVFVEFHSFRARPQRLDALVGALAGAGYRLHVLPELVAERPFLALPEQLGMDMRLNVFAFRA